jgi:hypothetical protein
MQQFAIPQFAFPQFTIPQYQYQYRYQPPLFDNFFSLEYKKKNRPKNAEQQNSGSSISVVC